MDVVVEHAVLVAVFVEQAEGVGVGKVFKLDEAVYSKPVGGEERTEDLLPLANRGLHRAVGRHRAAGGVWYGSFTGVLATWLAPGLLGSAHLIIDENGAGAAGHWAWWSAELASLSLMWTGGPQGLSMADSGGCRKG